METGRFQGNKRCIWNHLSMKHQKAIIYESPTFLQARYEVHCMSFCKGTLETSRMYQRRASAKANKCTCLRLRFSAAHPHPDSIALSELLLSCHPVSVRKMWWPIRKSVLRQTWAFDLNDRLIFYHFSAISNRQHKCWEQWLGVSGLGRPALNCSSHRQTEHGNILREWKISVICSWISCQDSWENLTIRLGQLLSEI